MSKYRVHLDYYAITDIMVEAESEAEAKALALTQELKFEDFDMELEAVEVYNESKTGGKDEN